MSEQRIVLQDGKVVGRFDGEDAYAVHRAAIDECRRRGYRPNAVWVDNADDSGKPGRPVHYGIESCPVVRVGKSRGVR